MPEPPPPPEKSYVKIIKSGNVYETYEYQKPVMLGLKRGGRLADGELSDRDEENRNLTTRRARNMFRRLVLNNFNDGDKFITLTFRDTDTLSGGKPIDIRNIDDTNREFKKFIQRLKRWLDKTGKMESAKLKYMAVIEFQDENRNGVIHYHIICNVPYIEHEKLTELWGLGYVWINRTEGVDNVGAYVTKYMMKDLHDKRLRGKKAYLVSKGLERPEVIQGEMAHRILQDLERENKKNKVFADEYLSDYCGAIQYSEYNIRRTVEATRRRGKM